MCLHNPLFSDSSGIRKNRGKNTISLEYPPVLIAFAGGGAGLGLGYERYINEWFSLHIVAMAGFLPAANSGNLTTAGLSVEPAFFPFPGLRGITFGIGCGVLYLSATGEDLYGGLESHLIIPYFKTSAGWRFVLGRKKIRFTIQPEIVFSLLLSGRIGSGPGDNLVWHSAGYSLGTFFPNLVLGVNF